jgi:hypothetical protein
MQHQNRTFRPVPRRGNRLTASVFVALIALPLLAIYVHARHREQEKRQLSPIAQRAATLCNLFNEGCRVSGPPVYWDSDLPRPEGRRKIRHIWSVECTANGRSYALLFNAATGELCSLFAQGRTSRTTFTEPPSAPIQSSEQAVEASLRLMKRLHLVPAGSKIALAETPAPVRTREAWEIQWNVRRPDSATPSRLKMFLDRRSSVPILYVDTHALNQTI